MKPGLVGALTGLAEIRDVLAKAPENDGQAALNQAAAGYVDRPYPWQTKALRSGSTAR